MATAEKITVKRQRKTLAQIRRARSEAGRKGGIAKAAKSGRGQSIATLEKEIIKKNLEQRYMRVVPQIATAQISLATGQQFLYKIEKKEIIGPKGGVRYENQKPVLVTSPFEIEAYLERLAEENGSLDDDQDPAATYYYLTTKEPNNEALKDIQNRVFGKPTETVDLNEHHTFSLVGLAAKRALLDHEAVPELSAPKIDEA